MESTLLPGHFCASGIAGRNPVLLMGPVTPFEKILTERLKARGIPLIYVISRAERDFPRYKGNFDPANFLGGIVYEGDFQQVIDALRPLPLPRAIFPGAEFTVENTEILRRDLKHPIANVPELIRSHWDKFALGELMHNSGFPFAKQGKGSSVQALLDLRAREFTFPVFLKPLAGMGSHQTHLIRDDSELIKYATAAFGEQNVSLRENREMMLQPDLAPVDSEFVVDTISSHGRHKVLVVGQYFREYVDGSGYMLREGRLLDPNSAEARPHIQRALAQLKVMGIRFGYTHLESIRGVLTDVGHRFSGTFPSLALAATGVDPIEMTIDAFLDGDAFFARPDIIPLLKSAAFFAVRSYADGSVYQLGSNEEVTEHLKAMGIPVHLFNGRAAPGSVWPKTIDLMKMPGLIELVGTEDEVNEGLSKLRQLATDRYFLSF